MALHKYPGRFLFVTSVSSLLLLGLCGTVAVYLNQEQSKSAEVLDENIGSQKAAANLEETLVDLIIKHEHGAKVEAIHDQIEDHLRKIEQFIDKPAEREYAQALVTSYRKYLRMWKQSIPGPELVNHLQQDTLRACQKLRVFNADQIEKSEEELRNSLKRMAWGLAFVGGLGSVAGLVLGYGLTRSLKRTLHQLLVRVQGASEMLGQEVPAVEWQGTGEPLEDGAADLVLRVEQVVQKLQQKEREIRRAERLAAVGQLAAGVAHEIRNPLTSAILLIETGRKDPTSGGITEEDLDLIEQELHRIESSLKTFLDYARPPRLKRSACDLGGVIREAIQLMRAQIEQHQVKVNVDLPGPFVPIQADGEQLRQVILNLVLNALDSMPNGGRLDIQVHRRQGKVELVVSDTGSGIAADILPKLFEPFATGKETGIGLGLVVSKRIVEEHGGSISGSNLPASGARFIVSLPAPVMDDIGFGVVAVSEVV